MEKRLRIEVPYNVFAGQWIEFTDARGYGCAQPDFYFVTPKLVVLLEAKLTQHEAGLLQITHLYRPLLRYLYRLPVVGILVCKNVVNRPTRQIETPLEVLDLKLTEDVYLWHFI